MAGRCNFTGGHTHKSVCLYGKLIMIIASLSGTVCRQYTCAGVRVFGLVLIPCLQLISHDFIHVYSQEKLFNAFECKQPSDESSQIHAYTRTTAHIHTRTPAQPMTVTKGRSDVANISFFHSVFLAPIFPTL